ncbi:hypothetical protein ACJZ2D_013062 [Fusarium nematophilum]
MEAEQDRGQALQNLTTQSHPSERHFLHPDSKRRIPNINPIEPHTNASPSMKLPSSSNMEWPLEEQFSHLESRLEAITLERDQAQDAVDKVVWDLLAVKDELEDAKKEVAHGARQITELRDQLLTLSRELEAKERDIASLQQESARVLGGRIADTQALQKRFDELPAEAKGNDNADLVGLQKMTLHLETQLKAKDEELAEHTARVIFLQRQEAESKSQQIHQAAQALEGQKRLEAAEAKVQALQRELQQAQTQPQTSQATPKAEKDHARLRDLMAYYKSKVETASKKQADLEHSKKQLGAALRDKERLIQEQEGLMADLRVQLG